MQVKILHAESLRFPGEGKSAQGQSEAKMRPKGVIDAQQVNIPAPAVKVEPLHVVFQGRSPDQMWGFRKIEAALLPKSVEEGSRKVQRGRHSRPY
jgi:hypothetical protein